jgi:hypothetical protein
VWSSRLVLILVRCKRSGIGTVWCGVWLREVMLIFSVLADAQGWEGPLLYVCVDSAAFIVGWMIGHVVSTRYQLTLATTRVSYWETISLVPSPYTNKMEYSSYGFATSNMRNMLISGTVFFM